MPSRTRSYALTVVVPTRGRPMAARRLLLGLQRQTLPPQCFEVVVVDDGSEPPLDAHSLGWGLPFPVQVLRRDDDHGAHASRRDGLRAALGERVLFLDDDIEPERQVLAAHAAPDLADAVAVGPILYPASARSTPYLRSMAHWYESCARAIRRDATGEFYFCNSSAPKAAWESLFGAVAGIPDNVDIVGGGFDDLLIGLELARRGIAAHFLPTALAWHHDQKTFRQAWQETRRAGAAMCQLVLSEAWVRPFSGLHTRFTSGLPSQRARRLALHAFWMMPTAIRRMPELVAAVVERAPARAIPPWVCSALLRVPYWEGVRTEAPSISALQATLRASHPTVEPPC